MCVPGNTRKRNCDDGQDVVRNAEQVDDRRRDNNAAARDRTGVVPPGGAVGRDVHECLLVALVMVFAYLGWKATSLFVLGVVFRTAGWVSTAYLFWALALRGLDETADFIWMAHLVSVMAWGWLA